MEKSGTEAPLLVDVDTESQVNATISRGGDDYVALPGSAGENAPQRSCRSVILTLTMGSIAALLLLSATFVSYNLHARSGGDLIEDGGNANGGNDYYKAMHSGYHFQPEKNFMSDPNAPMYYMGYYHFFYQYNPHGAIWGDIVWGHTVSTDLIHWLYLDVVLMPDQWYDVNGAWSGSATILKDGTPAILYTGGRTNFGADAEQSQNMALPVDPSDPLLRKWKKVDVNPILLNPEIIRPQDFRDPTTAWLENDGLWWLAVGSKKDNPDGSKDGMALMYNSKDFMTWNLQETLLHRVHGTGMWECVDLFPALVEGTAGLNHSVLRAEHYVDPFKYVLKASMDDTRHDHYAVGTYSTETHTFTPDDPSIDVGIGLRYDYGKFYASKSFYDTSTSRRILWGYVNESDSEKDDITKGWASVQAIPRTIWLDAKSTRNVLQWPVVEVEALRGAKATHEDIELQPTDVVKVRGGDGPQLDILVDFERPDVESADGYISDLEEFDCSQGGSAHRGTFGPFGILVNADTALTEHTAVFFYIARLSDGEWATRVCSDQSRSSLATGLDKTVYGSDVTVLPSENVISLRVLLDHSIVESFVQGGRLAITSRVYPTMGLGTKSRLFLFNNGTTPIRVKKLVVYQMGEVDMVSI